MVPPCFVLSESVLNDPIGQKSGTTINRADEERISGLLIAGDLGPGPPLRPFRFIATDAFNCLTTRDLGCDGVVSAPLPDFMNYVVEVWMVP